MENKNVRKICYCIIPTIIFLIGLYIYKYNAVFVDSDASSALLYSEILNIEHTFFSNNWYYATLVPVIEYQLVYSVLFSFFSNWLIVRAVGTAIVLLIYILSICFCMKEMNVKNIPLCMILLLMPFSIVYFGMYISMPWYVFTSIKIFLSIGLIFRYYKTEKRSSKAIIVGLICLLGLIQGLEGLRSVVQFIIPMVLAMLATVIIDQYNSKDKLELINKNTLFVPFSVFISCVIGYAIYSLILAKQYLLASYSDINFISLTPDSVIQEVNSWLNVFGYTNGSVFSTASIHNALSFIMVILSIIVIVYNLKHYKEIKNQSRVYTLYYCFAVAIMICFGLFIDINKMGLYDVARYNVPVAVMAVPLIVDWFENNNTNIIVRYVYVVFAVLMIICGLDNYRLCANSENKELLANINTGRVNNNTVELQDVVYMLNNKGYKNGYSYYWCGNVITELSNGDIEMWILGPGGDGTNELKTLDERYKWNQLKSHVGTSPEGKVFIIFNQDELDYSEITKRLDWDNMIYNSDNYTVYGYESNEELVKDFNH